MKKLFVVLFIVIPCLGLAISGFASDQSNTLDHTYVQTAKSAVLEELSTNASPSYTLTLKDIQPNVAYVPADQVTHNTLTIKTFIKTWAHPPAKNNLKKNTPNTTNAILKGINTSTQEEVNIPCELSNPQYNQDKKTLTYKINYLPEAKKLSSTIQLTGTTLTIVGYCVSCIK